MDCLVDKDLAGWLHAKYCGQWISEQMEISDEWCPSGVSVGADAAQHLCFGNVDSGIEGTLSKFT